MTLLILRFDYWAPNKKKRVSGSTADYYNLIKLISYVITLTAYDTSNLF